MLRRIQSTESDEKATLLDNLNIILRVRPLVGLEKSQKEHSIKVNSNQNQVELQNSNKTFKAKMCFGPETNQNTFYSAI